MSYTIAAAVIEDYGDRAQVELTLGDQVAYAFYDENQGGWSLADEGEADALPETEEAFAGWEPVAQAALDDSRARTP